MKKLTVEKFIEKAKEKHGSYDYSLVQYHNNVQKVIIICQKHGQFLQSPAEHLRGHGCKNCRKDKLREKYILTQEEFLKRIKKKFGDKFDYSLVVYRGMHNPVKLTCKIHGLIEKKAQYFVLQKTGCAKCGDKEKSLWHLSCTEKFIKKSKQTWGTIYDYSQVVYQNEKIPVNIICKTHGVFKVKPNRHLYSQQGCSMCTSVSKGELVIETFFKENKLNYERQKTFEQCIDKKKLRFDFYLPEYNMCVEYDGIFHYKPYKDDKQSLNSAKRRDEIKNKFCSQNNIKLLRIPYWKFKEITKILTLNIKNNDTNTTRNS